jgi:hypothetical protein
MRVLFLLLGILAIALGGLVLSGKLARSRQHDVLDIGVLRAEATTREAYPQWLGFGALTVGAVLLIAASRQR